MQLLCNCGWFKIFKERVREFENPCRSFRARKVDYFENCVIEYTKKLRYYKPAVYSCIFDDFIALMQIMQLAFIFSLI